MLVDIHFKRDVLLGETLQTEIVCMLAMVCWNLVQIQFGGTLPETNIAPENRPLEKAIPFGNPYF